MEADPSQMGNDGLLYTDLYGQLTILNPDTLEHKELGIKSALFTLGMTETSIMRKKHECT